MKRSRVSPGTRTASLFGGSSADVQNAIRSLSTKKGFGELGQRFFGRFVARFLNFYLSRVTAAALGSPRLQDLGEVAEFNDALRSHCDQSARIVRDFCGEWYSKTEYQKGIDLENTSRFLAVALKKLRSELEQQKADIVISPRLFLCSGAKIAPSDPVAAGRQRIDLDSIGKKANVHIRFENVAKVFHQHLSPRLVDLLEIASYVYSADCATSRGKAWTDDDSTEPWGRDFAFVIPVREPDFWNSSEITDLDYRRAEFSLE